MTREGGDDTFEGVPSGDATISVIIPTVDEAERIAASVVRARAIGDEVIVVDGGSSDDTAKLAKEAGARVVVGPRGRGPQLHTGACSARGDVLLFLHADVELPARARTAILDALEPGGVVGGNFALEFTPSSWSARLFSWANDMRRRWFRIYYGDSAIFVRREVYETLGGFRALPILEDYELVRRLERHGSMAYVRSVVVEASARRFAHAPVRTLMVWTWIQLLYSVFGVSPERLSRHYADIRG